MPLSDLYVGYVAAADADACGVAALYQGVWDSDLSEADASDASETDCGHRKLSMIMFIGDEFGMSGMSIQLLKKQIYQELECIRLHLIHCMSLHVTCESFSVSILQRLFDMI